VLSAEYYILDERQTLTLNMFKIGSRKRKHHYVWKNYLRAWAINEQIFCRLDGKIINPNLIGIAQERDFYQIIPLTAEDVQFIQIFIIERTIGELRKIQEDFLGNYLIAQNLTELGEDWGKENQEIETATKTFKSNFLEDWHCSIELSASGLLESLRAGETSIFNNYELRADFLIYVCTQYFRTKNIKTAVLTMDSPIKKEMLERTHNLTMLMLATTMAYNLEAYMIKLLINPTSLELLTADQPIINTYANPMYTGNPPEKTELYYPISPSKAIMITSNTNNPQTKTISLDEKEVQRLNYLMVAHSRKQVFASSYATLQKYVQGPY
jgi:hypothetical protein